MKTHAHPPAGFFAAEAARAALARARPPTAGCTVPEVLARRRRVPDPALGRAGQGLRRRRRGFGQALAPPTRPARAAFGGEARRLHQPAAAAQHAVRHLGGVLRRPPGAALPQAGPRPRRGDRGRGRRGRVASSAGSPTLLPEEPPARLHGDLWNGNVLWGQDGQVWLIDPAAYGGHRELDLAMLALFGMPHLPRVLDAYQEAAPLAEGWEDRVAAAPAVPAARARRALRRRLRRPGRRGRAPRYA